MRQFFLCLFIISVNLLAAAILTVPEEYTTIQSAIDACAENDTVVVSPGNYAEHLTISNNSITLGSLYITSGDESYIADTVISGAYNTGHIIIVQNSGMCSLRGFTISRSELLTGRLIYSSISNIELDHLHLSDMAVSPPDALIRLGGGSVLIDGMEIANLTNPGDDSDVIRLNGVTEATIINSTITGVEATQYTESWLLSNTGITPLYMSNVSFTENNYNGINWRGEVEITGMELAAGFASMFSKGMLVDGNVNISDSEISGFGANGIELADSELEMHNTQLLNNGWGMERVGGGLRAENVNVVMSGSTLNGNQGVDGGGAWLNECEVIIDSCQIAGNSSGNRGGGIYSATGNLEITNCEIYGNSGVLEGGGVYGNESDLILEGSNISGNNSGSGGGLYLENLEAEIYSCVIDSNSSSLAGGGIFLFDDSENDIIIENSSIIGNICGGAGGGMKIELDDVTITDCEIAGNQAGTGGAGDIKADDVLIENCEINSNMATTVSGFQIQANESVQNT
ncbi:MAG: hypothetical protein K9M99_09390 [Candidatus Cloacimonetes bacterium]|nr:hypothetical protein [Candidatus Cloacimonadota bacterium]